VYFEGTPLQLRQPALYRNKVRLSLPQISQIDASECFPLELFLVDYGIALLTVLQLSSG
jgi:hypothetical protein